MIHLPHHLHHQNPHHHFQIIIIQIKEMIPVIHQVILVSPVMTVEANQENQRKEQRNTKQSQEQQEDTGITQNYSINYAEQQRTTDWVICPN